jgi:hypothetical protein
MPSCPSLKVSAACQNTSWSYLAAKSRKGKSSRVMDMALRVFSSSKGSIFRAILIQFV